MIGVVVFLIVCILFFLFTLGIIFFIYNLKIRSWKRQNPEYAVVYFERVNRNDYPKENVIGTRCIRISHVDGEYLHFSKIALFCFNNKILIAKGMHEVNVQRVNQYYKSKIDNVLFEEKIEFNFRANKQYIVRNDGELEHFKIEEL
ncbi:MAG: hypothetical protein HXM07_05360 [Fusobacterium periodonticum]|nr:hypothetical protein [Fusobacterium periodonticum]